MNYYDTPDLGIAAMLITLGNKVEGVREDKKGRVIFTFESTKYILELVGDYFGKGVSIDAKTYYYNVRALKKQIAEIKKGVITP